MTLPFDTMTLMSQSISVSSAHNLHTPSGELDGHGHKAFGLYDEVDQAITLDDELGHEMARSTFLHESLHAMLAFGQLDTLMNVEMPKFDEHFVGAFTPILLDWLRSNPVAVAYLTSRA